MIEIIIGVFVVIVAAILVYAATKPDAFKIERQIVVAAPPEKVFPLVNDFHAHISWSPFEKDPAIKRAFSGAAQGKGSVYEWSGNREVGAGRISITDSSPPSKVTLLLEMFKPFKARNTVMFSLEPNGSGTNVRWSMQGAQPYLAKLVSTFVDCDKMVGRQFEEGLAKMKSLAEA
jgi:hypothetical protein